jgi:adenylate cyclase
MNKQVIICVDDEISLWKSLKSELKNALGSDYQIELAEGGEEALELIEVLQEEGYEIPLIISDYFLPLMKGDELLRLVHLTSPNTIKIMLTGQANLEAISNVIKYANLYRYIDC